jgi:hypothetical protein
MVLLKALLKDKKQRIAVAILGMSAADFAAWKVAL